MASCITTKWGNDYCPQVQLSVSVTSDTSTSSTLSWYLYYKTSGYAIYDTRAHDYSVTIGGSTEKSGTYVVNGITSTSTTIASGTKTITKTTSAQTINFSLSFDWNTIKWNNVNSTASNETASGSIVISAKTTTTYTLSLTRGTGVATFTGAGTYSSGTQASTKATPSTGYHLTYYSGTTWNGSGTSTWNVTNAYEDETTWSMGANRSVTLYAEKNHVKVFYNANGGTASSSSYGGLNQYGFVKNTDGSNFYQTVTYGTSIDPYNATTFGLTKPGYTFGGWYLYNRSEGITSTVLNQNTTYTPNTYYSEADKNITVNQRSGISCYLYAKWDAEPSYTLTINPNGGTYVDSLGNISTASTTKKFLQSHNYVAISTNNETAGATSPTTDTGVQSGYYISQPTRKGYKFKGWLRSDTNTNAIAYQFSIAVMYGFENPRKNVTVTAQWEPDGVVKIYNGSVWKNAIPYIYNGSEWKEAKSYVYKSSTWTKTSG